MTRIVALLLVLIGQPQQTPPRDTRAGALAATGSITGVVVSDEAQPRPLRRARVTLGGQAPGSMRAVITGDDGTFVFDDVPEGWIALLAAKEAYVTMSYGATRPGRPGTGVKVTAGQSVAVTLRLPRGAVITGTVLDIDGRPAAGVPVSALYPRVGGALVERLWVSVSGVMPAVTDDRGAYRIYGLPAGEYLVSTLPVARPPVAPQGDVRMMLRGTGVSRPMALAQVLHPGVSDVSRAARVAVRAGEERGGVDVQLEYVPLATISGTVSSPVGWGPVRVTLWRTDEMALPQSGPVATADDQGRFTFRAVRPGNYRIAARVMQLSPSGGRGNAVVADVQYGFADVAVSGEDLEGIALSLRPGLSISGQVVFESGQGVAPTIPSALRLPAPAYLASASGGWPLPPVMIDGTRFRIDGVVPGAYRMMSLPQGVRAPIGSWWLKSVAAGGRELLDAPLTLQHSVDDAVVTFSDRASELAGSIRDAQGAPGPGLYVVAFPVDRAGWFVNSRRIAAVRAGRDGLWSIRNLPPGDYRVAAADLDQNEWFDPAALEALLPGATPVRIIRPELYKIELVVR